jgi:hypothetical protein
LAFKGYASSSVEYMHLDFADNNVAIISGRLTCMWFIKSFPCNGETNFSITDLLTPECLTIPFNNSPNVMHARSVHFLSETGTALVSFVEDDIHGTNSQL